MADLGAGTDFAGHRIEEVIGRGGMGVVYRAIDLNLEREVAVKVITPQLAGDEDFRARFRREWRLAASIRHPHVVTIYRAGDDDGQMYVSMDYIAGTDLRAMIDAHGALQPRQATGIIEQVAGALDAAHAAGLVHRDIKPANVLIAQRDGFADAYLTDFGLSKQLRSGSTALTKTGMFVGTVDYVAPEQLRGDPVDARADIYSLGCVLYEALTGDIPFPRDSEPAKMWAHVSEPPPSARARRPELSPEIDEVLQRAMAKDPDDRFPSAGDLGRAAVAALSGAPVAIPERTVATGAAATVEPETIAPAEPTAEATPEPTAATGRLDPEPPDDTLTEPEVEGPKRNPKLIAGALAAIAAIVIVGFVITSSGGGGGEQTTAGNDPTTEAPVDKTEEETPKKEPESDRLSRAELAARANEICSEAKASFKQARGDFPEAKSEELFDVGYSEALVSISTRAVREFKALTPPKPEEGTFGRYLRVQERIKDYDQQALTAAEAEDNVAYLQARERRNVADPERWELAEAMGFDDCVGQDQ